MVQVNYKKKKIGYRSRKRGSAILYTFFVGMNKVEVGIKMKKKKNEAIYVCSIGLWYEVIRVFLEVVCINIQ